ncbi:MAG: hypothetical protein LBU89_04290 [Fibromonadaceae bacterium]|jgi:hypothetical protein|nr:hypothetical protein [Fibromonadaceae bacterium]
MSINQDYNYFQNPSTAKVPEGFSAFLSNLKLAPENFTYTSSSPLTDSFSVTAELNINNRTYQSQITATTTDGKVAYKMSSKHLPSNPKPIMDLYPMSPVRSADNYFGTLLTDRYDNIFVSIETIENLGNDSILKLKLFFKNTCPLWQRYQLFMPAEEQIVEFEGPVEDPFSNPKYQITGLYRREAALPLLEFVPLSEMELTFISHVEDLLAIQTAEMTKQYVSLVTWRGKIKLGEKFPAFLIGYNIYNTAQSFDISAGFEDEEGLKISDVFGLLASLSGKEDTDLEMPDWLILKDVALRSIAFRLEKELASSGSWHPVNHNKFVGVGVMFGLKLPSIPIPFLENQGDFSFYLQWDMLDIGGALSAVVSFESEWKGYLLNISIQFPDFFFKGRLARVDEQEYPAIFPGFSNLSLKHLEIAGTLPQRQYMLEFYFDSPKEQQFNIGEVTFDIYEIKGNAYYTPEGAGLGIELGFFILDAYIGISGSYETTGEQQHLRLAGGLNAPLNLLDLINHIFGTDIGNEKLELVLKRLWLEYDGKVEDKEGPWEGEFSFWCTVEFKWDFLELSAMADVALTPGKLQLGGYIELLGFLFAATADIDLKSGNIETAKLKIKFGRQELEAELVDENKAIRIKMLNLNIGELIEDLINRVRPNANWYLPWPFKILKRVSFEEIEVTVNDYEKSIRAKLVFNLNVLFFKIESLEIFYNYGDGSSGDDGEKFWVNLSISGLINELNTPDSLGSYHKHGMDLLNNIFPALPGLADSVFKLEYLAVGQRVKVEIPTEFDKETLEKALKNIKTAFNNPVLDPKNNWVLALQLKLLKSIDVNLLMCDPNFYGLSVEVSKGSEITEQLDGLHIMILYAKVTDTIGVFHGHLTLPKKFRMIELGPVQVTLGEIAISIYTNGNFRIDLGFPHNNDFSRSFGVTYLFFTGVGGFYFAVLNGDTSKRVPKATSGHFDTVIELGLGLSVGVGREFSVGIARGGAHFRLLAIFNGVFASYIADPKSGNKDEIYYCVEALAGIEAAIYGEVDFCVIKINFSAKISAIAAVQLESYKETILTLEIKVGVEASIKILFIKINFKFNFTWKDEFVLGRSSPAPWESSQIQNKSLKEYSLVWEEKLFLDDITDIYAEVVPHFSIDGVKLNADGEPLKHKAAFLPFLHGFQEETLEHLSYTKERQGASIAILIKLLLTRALTALQNHEKPVHENDFTQEDIAWLLEQFTEKNNKETTFNTGFSLLQIYELLDANLRIHLSNPSVELASNTEIHGVPFPMPPVVKVIWDEENYDLSIDPPVEQDFIDEIQKYFEELSKTKSKPIMKIYANSEKESASALLFRDYFTMLTRIALSQAYTILENVEKLTAKEIVDKVLSEDSLSDICGMVSRFLLGGLRVPDEENNSQLIGLYQMAHQQFDSDPKSGKQGIVHSFSIEKHLSHEWLILENHAPASAVNSQKLLFGIGEQTQTLQWDITDDMLEYPPETISVSATPLLKSFYTSKQVTIGLKNPVEISESESVFYESQEPLPQNCTLEFRTGDEPGETIGFERGFLLYISITKVAGDVYSINALGKQNIDLLYEIKDKQITEARMFRFPTPKETEKKCVELENDTIFLYRSNLCLESELPVNLKATYSANKNSAHLSNAEINTFISLLRDASLVNSKGYYLTCNIPKGGSAEDGSAMDVLEDGSATILLWLKCGSDARAILASKTVEGAVPAIIDTDKYYDALVYEPGDVAFSLSLPEEFSDYNLLSYRIVENDFFNKSNESMPLSHEMIDEKWVYSQLLPAYSYAKGENPENPYGGIKPNSRLQMDFCFLDILGNRTTRGISLNSQYKYWDPLLSPATYPDTQIYYDLAEKNGKLQISVSCKHKEGEERPAENTLKLCYWQLAQPDVVLELGIFDKWETIDKGIWLAYLKDIMDGNKPNDVSIEKIIGSPVAEKTDLVVALRISRSEILVVPEKTKTDVCSVTFELLMNEGDSPRLAKDSNGNNLLVGAPTPFKFGDIGYWAMPPLRNKLITLTDISVTNINGTKQTASFHNIDLEEWADIFLADFEHYISPDSEHYKDQETLEKLLDIKARLAEAISWGVDTVNEKGDESKRQKAKQVFLTQMQRNLYTGRRTDSVAILDTGIKPPTNVNFLGSIVLPENEKDETNASFSCSKIENDGLLAISVRKQDITAQKNLKIEVEYSLAHWEIINNGENGRFDYLTLSRPVSEKIILSIPLPYKRFPSTPNLIMQKYEAANAEGKYFDWNYVCQVSHEMAAQDTMFMQLEFNNLTEGSNKPLPEALAQYIFLREQIQAGVTGSAEVLVDVSDKICKAWEDENNVNRMAQFEVEEATLIEIENNCLVFRGSGPKPSKVSVLMQDNEWNTLPLTYKLPEEPMMMPYCFQFTFPEFDIREKNVVNLRTWVKRNQNISEIDVNPRFVYETEKVRFHSQLEPVTNYSLNVNAGTWDRDNFISWLNDIVKGFSSMNLEIFCGRILSYTEPKVISFIPVVFAPGKENEFDKVFDATDKWLMEHIAHSEEHIVIKTRAVFFGTGRALAEIENIFFFK